MDLLLSASIVAAFIAGVAALFAPCCITVLLPSYFASIFRERHKIFLMTFIFFLGILIVFLPIGLGAAVLGQIFSRYHNTIFTIGGIFLIILGIILLTGRHFSMPFKMSSSLKRHNALSVFSLGIFSGIATTCCAPVLAGVLTLAALPGSLFWGAAFTLSYVLGMVAPLFLISLFLDKVNFSQKFGQTFRKPIEYSIGIKKISVTLAEAISGATFFIMGAFIIYLASTNRLFVHSGYQTMLNIYLTKFMNLVGGFVKIIPEYVWVLILIIIIIYLIKKCFNNLKKKNMKKKINLLAVVIIVLLVVLIGLMIYNGSKNKNGSTAVDQHGHSPAANRFAAPPRDLTNQPAPDFTLADQSGKIYALNELRGKNVVLFFNEGLMCYPACWNQIVSLSKDERFKNDNTVVLSVVVDSPRDWQSAIEKMPELAAATVVFDKNATVSNKFGVLTTASSMHYGSLPGHTFIIIDKTGMIRYMFDDPQMGLRNDQLVTEIEKLN